MAEKKDTKKIHSLEEISALVEKLHVAQLQHEKRLKDLENKPGISPDDIADLIKGKPAKNKLQDKHAESVIKANREKAEAAKNKPKK
jgi:predicted transcriptional regulator